MTRMIAIAMSAFLITVGCLWSPTDADAQRRRLIRDAEIEATIREMATPLFEVAGIVPDAVDILLVEDDALNAFVAGGQNMFLYTGFLLATESPLEVIGVIAHETGHIAGGHIVRTADAIRGASSVATVASILGAATAILAGRGDAAAAIIAGGQSTAQRQLLNYSRTQESAADQAALRYLDETGQSARGMLRFFERLGGQELLLRSGRSAYAGTHPLTQERIATVRRHLDASPLADKPVDPDIAMKHARMVAKIHAFVRSTVRTFRKYPESDQSLPARYARAIAVYQDHDFDRAVTLVDDLLREVPNDPYFHELKGQILFEAGRPGPAAEAYEKAAVQLPESGLIALETARAHLAVNTPSSNERALVLLKEAIKTLGDSPFTWRQLAIAHGRNGDEGLAALALAEEALLQRRARDAGIQAKRAQSLIPRGTEAWLRTLDIEEQVKRTLQQRK